jgi:hypothetical protein
VFTTGAEVLTRMAVGFILRNLFSLMSRAFQA